VSVVRQLLNSPCQDHWNALIWILKYIRNASSRSLNYEDKRENIQIVVYFDVVDWEGLPSNKCTTLGYGVIVGGNLIL